MDPPRTRLSPPSLPPLIEMSSGNAIHPGRLHCIPKPIAGQHSPPLTTFEHGTEFSSAKDSLIFLGGLFDGLLTVPFVPPIVAALPPEWTLIEPTLSSSYRQWGFSSLGENVAEIAVIVEYFRRLRPGGRIVLLGHSTGSQQIMQYLLCDKTLPAIHGAILQAGASDREAMTMFIGDSEYESACKLAQSYLDDGRGDDILPFNVTSSSFMSAPVSARRWLSLASPGPSHSGEDDLFSSDLDDDRLATTFGRLGKKGSRLSFLFSGEDQYVPYEIDKMELVERWHVHVKRGGGIIDEGSGIVEDASHTLKEGGKGLESLVDKVLGFLCRLERR